MKMSYKITKSYHLKWKGSCIYLIFTLGLLTLPLTSTYSQNSFPNPPGKSISTSGIVIADDYSTDGFPWWGYLIPLPAGAIIYVILQDGDPEPGASTPPTASDDQINIPCNGSGSLNVLSNDMGSNIEVTNITSSSNATITHSGNGIIMISNVGSTSFTFNYTIKNDQDQTAQAVVTITIIPNPIMATEDNFTFEVGATVNGNVLSNDIGDNLQVINHTSPTHGTLTISSSGQLLYSPSSNFCGQEEISYTIVDDCEQEANSTVLFSGIDTEKPTVSCPPDLTIECSESSEPSETGQAGAEDNCSTTDQISITYTDDKSGLNLCNGTGILTRLWTATDAGGNSESCVQLIQVEDSTSPTISCPSDISLDCGSAYDPTITGTAVISDLCGEVSLLFQDDVSGLNDCAINGVIIREWIATDDCGNVSQCIQTITILSDQEAPEINCPPNISISCGDDIDPSSTGIATASDNCSTSNQISIIYEDSDLDPSVCNPSLVRIWTAVDSCGNVATCEQTITLEDQSHPAITCPGDISIQCTASSEPEVTGFPTANDDCDEDLTITFSDEFIPNGLCAGTIIRTWFATDNCDNQISCLQNIILEEVDCDFVYNIIITDANCGLNDGGAAITVSPGPNAQGPFTILWSDGQMGNQALGLSAGQYQVTILDDGIGCSQEIDFQILQSPADLVGDIEVIPISCSSNGDILIDLQSPGIGPIDVSVFFPGGGVQTILNISNNSTFALSDWLLNPFPGEYTFTITDQSTGSSCQQTITANLPQSLPITITLEAVIPPSGPLNNDGQILINVDPISGVTPFEVYVNDNPIGSVNAFNISIINVPSGFYQVFVVDALGCASNVLDIIVPNGIPLNFNSDPNLNLYNQPNEIHLDVVMNNNSSIEHPPIVPNLLVLRWDKAHFVNTITADFGLDETWHINLELSHIYGEWQASNSRVDNIQGSMNRLIFSPYLTWAPKPKSEWGFFLDGGIRFFQSDIHLYRSTLNKNYLLRGDDKPNIFGRVAMEFQLNEKNVIRLMSEWVSSNQIWKPFLTFNFNHQFQIFEKFNDYYNNEVIRFKQ